MHAIAYRGSVQSVASPLLSQQVGCQVRQAIPWRSPLHLLPTQMLDNITRHHPDSHLVAREGGWVGQAGVGLRVPASKSI